MRRTASACCRLRITGASCWHNPLMLINPGSHRPQGPWDPHEKKKWIDTTNFWALLPILVLMVAGMALGIIYGY